MVNSWIALRFPLLLLAVVAGVVAFPAAGRLQFDRSIENMFTPGDPILAPYEKLKRTFGGNEIVMAVYDDPGLLSPDGQAVQRLTKISRRLKAVSGVKDVLSLDQPLGQAIVDDNPVAQRTRKLFEGYTHGSDGRTVCVGCMLVPRSESRVPREATIDAIRRIVAALPSGTVAGEPVMVADGYRFVEEDGRRLGWASAGLLALVIVLCFRSLRWVLLPLAVVQWAILLTQAVLVWSGLRLSMVSSMLAAIVTVVGIGAVVHIIVRYREARLAGQAPREALAATALLLAGPIFWSLATDVVGFGSLLLNSVEPIADFGLMMVLGCAMVLVGMALILPAGVLIGRFDRDPRRAWGEGHLDAQLERMVQRIRRRPWTTGLVTALVATAAIAGTWRLQVETDFTRNFRGSSSIVRSYELIEHRLGGAAVWDVILPAPESLDWSYLRRVLRLEDRLRREIVVDGPDGRPAPGLTKVISLADAVVAGSPIEIDSVRLTTLKNAMVSTGLKLLRQRMPVFAAALYGEDPKQAGQHYFRIMLRAREQQPAGQKERLIRQVQIIARQEFSPTTGAPGAEVTGFFVLLTNLIHSILRDQWITFAAATAGIGLMMLVALRSVSYALVALVPNALPILVVTGLIGWLGLRVNMGAAMIAAVSMGLSIDSSIHYITSFRRTRNEGRSVHEALAATQQSVGRAVVFSTLALVAGFLVLCWSQFVPTIYFGVLVSLTMLGGLVGNLVVLPLLLGLIVRERERLTG